MHNLHVHMHAIDEGTYIHTCISTDYIPFNPIVSRSQTQTDAQGLIACSISARAVRVWTTDTARFILATTQNWVSVDWLKGVRHLYRSPLKGFHPWKCVQV